MINLHLYDYAQFIIEANKGVNSADYFFGFKRHHLSNEYVAVYLSDPESFNRQVIVAIRENDWTWNDDIAISFCCEFYLKRYKMIAKLLHQLRYLYSTFEIFLLAHSNGATMARRLTLEYPDKITQAIIFNPAFSFAHMYEALIGRHTCSTNKYIILRNKVHIHRIKDDIKSVFSKWSIPLVYTYTLHKSNDEIDEHALENFLDSELQQLH